MKKGGERMKIIKNTMTEPIEVECPNCKSIIAYTYDEINRRTNYNFFGLETGVKQYVICPVCKCDIDRTPSITLELKKESE